MARILVIDDSRTIAAAVSAALAPDGHEVSTLDVFTSLRRIIHDEPPDLVLLDLEIPVLSGVEFARFIRRYQPHDFNIPILIHSSRSELELERAALQVGAVGWISKGAPSQVLRETVRESLEAAKSP